MNELDDIFQVHHNLYIGAYWPRLNFDKLKQIGITAIVNLMDENLYNPIPFGFSYLHKGFPDDTYPPHSYIKTILDFIDEHVKRGKVLVHCAMGISRISYVNKSKLIFPAIEIRESVLDYLENIDGFRRYYK